MKFYGVVGYGDQVEVEPGVIEDRIVARMHFGDITRLSNAQRAGSETVNVTVTASHTISIVTDPYATLNFAKIRYVEWGGAYWTVSNMEVQPPRLILTLGEVYNGPTAPAPGSSGSSSG